MCYKRKKDFIMPNYQTSINIAITSIRTISFDERLCFKPVLLQ